MPVVARPLDVRPYDSADISCANSRETEVGKEKERKKEGTTAEAKPMILPMSHHHLSILLIDARRRPPT